MLLGTLGASLLGNLLTGKAQLEQGATVTSEERGRIRTGQDF